MSNNHSAFRRRNPLNGEWVLVSPHRNNRPWSGAVEELSTETRPDYDASCPLCPSNTRVNGVKNPEYQTTFVFANDFAALTDVEQTKSKYRTYLPKVLRLVWQKSFASRQNIINLSLI